MKSNYFKNMLSGESFKKTEPSEDGSYYVDCDSDVMTELIAYMETGHFKYKKICSKYLMIIMNKYGIDMDVSVKNNKLQSFNSLIEKIIVHLKEFIINKNNEIINVIKIKLVESACEDYEITNSINRKYSDECINYLCSFNYKLYEISSDTINKGKRIISEILKKYELDNTYYCDRIIRFGSFEIILKRKCQRE